VKLDVIRMIAGQLWRIRAQGKPRREGDQVVQTIVMEAPPTQPPVGKDQ
jgi:hypothetical protein